MKLGIASDHRGYQLKEELINYFQGKIDIVDFGTNSEESTDYPDYAFKLGENIVEGNVDLGVAICGSGIGISIACNKVKGIRCAKVDSVADVKATRKDNDANIIAFGENTNPEAAINYIEAFITTPASQEEKHVRRRNKISQYENGSGTYEF